MQLGERLPGYQKGALGVGYHVVGKGGCLLMDKLQQEMAEGGEGEGDGEGVGGWSKLVYRALTRRQHQDASMEQKWLVVVVVQTTWFDRQVRW